MIVGGLLASGLALGAGTASAATECKAAGVDLSIPSSVTDVISSGGQCLKDGKPLTLLDALAAGLSRLTGGGDESTTGDGSSTTPTGGTTTPADPTSKPDNSGTPKGDVTGGNSDAPVGSGTGKGTETGTGTGTGTPGNGSIPAAGPTGGPAPFVAPPAGAAAGPLGTFSPAALGGIAPAGLASNLFGANAYDPGLLFGSPLGGAAAQLFNPQAGSGVTTVSQAQVLSAPGRGYGTPATIGVIILACLIGFAVRHRVITRMKARDLPEDTAPRHAAPEAEQIEDDSEARTTVLTR